MGTRPRHISSSFQTATLDHEWLDEKDASNKRLGSSPHASYKQRRIGIQFLFQRLKMMPFSLAVIYSAATHVLAPVITAATFALLAFLLMWLAHINLWDYLKAKPTQQNRDVIFTLVPDTNADRPDSARFKAAFNQQAGGETKPDLDVAPPDTPSSESRPSPTQPEQQAAKASPPSPPKPQVSATLQTRVI